MLASETSSASDRGQKIDSTSGLIRCQHGSNTQLMTIAMMLMVRQVDPCLLGTNPARQIQWIDELGGVKTRKIILPSRRT